MMYRIQNTKTKLYYYYCICGTPCYRKTLSGAWKTSDHILATKVLSHLVMLSSAKDAPNLSIVATAE